MKKMMTNFILTFCLLFIGFGAFAQWQPLTSGTTETLLDIHFLNPSYGAAVGTDGTVLLTEDGGDSWTDIGGLGEDLGSVRVLGVDTILVAGLSIFDGQVYRTTNGGTTWLLETNGARLDRTTNEVYALGYDGIQSSDDQGESWQDLGVDLGGTLLMEQVQFADDDFGLIAGNISGFANYSTYGFFTNDGGNNWLDWYVFDFPNADAWTNASFAGPDTVYLFTNKFEFFVPSDTNRLVRMTDIHKETVGDTDTWRFTGEVVNALMPGYSFDAHFFDGHSGYSVTADGDILKTTDGGASWNVDYTAADTLRSIYAWSEDLMFATGHDGQILRLGQVNSTNDPAIHSLGIYPNPTHSTFVITGVEESVGELLIYNSLGEVIVSKSWQGDEIVISHLPKGLYHVVLQCSKQHYAGKILKIE